MRSPARQLGILAIAGVAACGDATGPEPEPNQFELEALAEGQLGDITAECDIVVLFTVVGRSDDGWSGHVRGSMKRVLTRGEDISALRAVVDGQVSLELADNQVRITFDGGRGDPFLGALATEMVGRQVSAGPPQDYLGTWSCAAFALPVGPFGDPALIAPGDWRMRSLE